MATVMAIIAVLMMIAASALFAVRDQAAADQAAEGAINSVRDAQNKAISFTKGTGENTKAWGVFFDADNDSIKLISVDSSGTNNEEETAEIDAAVDISVVNGDHVYFASPFATAYLCDGGANNWQESNNPSREYEPTDCVVSSSDIEVIFSFRNAESRVIIDKWGGISAN